MIFMPVIVTEVGGKTALRSMKNLKLLFSPGINNKIRCNRKIAYCSNTCWSVRGLILV
jgi:hypothetical protein